MHLPRAAVLGQGAREHALAWFLHRAGWRVWASADHPGLRALCQPLAAADGDIAALAEVLADLRIDLVVFGPEAPLVAGAADIFRRRGLTVLGPGAAAARLEGSKIFAKQWMQRHGLPTAAFGAFDDPHAAWEWAQAQAEPPVVKADGLAGGKGVVVPEDWQACRAALDQLMVQRRCGAAGAAVVVEQRLRGPELSAMALVGGGHFVLLPPVRDHKRAGDGDRGPQTGGMGAVAPVPLVSRDAWEQVAERIVAPAVRGLVADQLDFRGVLYSGLIWSEAGPQILEFNVRFGDPEAQVLLPLLGPEFAERLANTARGTLQRDEIWPIPSRCAAAVVVAAPGYPAEVSKGGLIEGTEPMEQASTLGESVLFQGSVSCHAHGGSAVSGGRIATAVGIADQAESARALAYRRAGQITLPGSWFRSDIGATALPEPSPRDSAGLGP